MCRGGNKRSKQFFFEKKNQKPFVPWAHAAGEIRDSRDKSFLLLFSKKQALLPLLRYQALCCMCRSACSPPKAPQPARCAMDTLLNARSFYRAGATFEGHGSTQQRRDRVQN